MRRRGLSVLGAVVLFAVALPGSAASAASGDRACARLLSAPAPAGAAPITPHVVYQETEGSADFTVLWIDAASGATDNTLTSCTFHDVDRDGRHDRSERVFAVQESLSVAPDRSFSKWPYSTVLSGVAEGQHVCTKRTLRSQPMARGRATTSTSALTCIAVRPTFGG